jgi:hypothetical protein
MKGVAPIRIEDPTASVMSGLGRFVNDSFAAVMEEKSRSKETWEALKDRMGEAKYRELIELYQIQKTHEGDMTSRLINPFAEVTAAQIESSGSQTAASDKLYEQSDKKVLQGITALNSLLETLSKLDLSKKEEPLEEEAPMENKPEE